MKGAAGPWHAARSTDLMGVRDKMFDQEMK